MQMVNRVAFQKRGKITAKEKPRRDEIAANNQIFR